MLGLRMLGQRMLGQRMLGQRMLGQKKAQEEAAKATNMSTTLVKNQADAGIVLLKDIAANLGEAIALKDKLLEYDINSEKRTSH